MLSRTPLLLLLASVPAGLLAEVVPHALFSDHAVLQQNTLAPVWGTAAPGEAVTVSFRGRRFETVADPGGNWRVGVETGNAGGVFELIIEGEKNTVSAEDVLVGEVWLCSGQSNMERQLGPRPGQLPIINADAEAARATYPAMRQFYVADTVADTPQPDVTGEWVVCTPETATDFTAVGFFFGRDLMVARRVPIGLINSTWGGTPAEAWTSAEAVARFPEFAAQLEGMRTFMENEEAALAAWAQALEQWFANAEPRGLEQHLGPAAAQGEWAVQPVPVMWEEAGHEGFDGIGWYRREIELPADWAGREAVLDLGRIDDLDTTWWNGVEVGSTADWQQPRRYTVPAGILRAGVNVLTVRVLDTGGGGGIWDVGEGIQIALTGDEAAPIDLRGAWQFRASVAMDGDGIGIPPLRPGLSSQVASCLYNGMIAPIVGYAMKGVIWYQGESNASDPRRYRDLFPVMIRDWRARWGRGDFPFLFVQIAPYEDQPPEIREAQFLTLGRVANTAMAVTIDVGDAEDIHPANKEPVGARLALAARALAYGESITYSGPLFTRAEFTGGRAVVHFDHVGPGLVAANGPLRGFVLAGADGDFHPATAAIEGEVVVVSCDEVPEPRAVRYGWANVADGNLFNRAGLPASPFRSDVD